MKQSSSGHVLMIQSTGFLNRLDLGVNKKDRNIGNLKVSSPGNVGLVVTLTDGQLVAETRYGER